jgi:hypothetical protein
VIPGLLQTAAHARENIAGITTFRTPDEVAALAEVRLLRQSVLTRPGQPLEFWAIVHEATLHQRFAVRPTTMRDQLRRLLDSAEMPDVTIRLMPSSCPPRGHAANVRRNSERQALSQRHDSLRGRVSRTSEQDERANA